MLERIFQEPKFSVCCLGAIKLVEAGSGTDMTPTSRKTRALLGYLCIVGKPVGRERLASLLWGDRGDEQARASLRQAIYELRSILGGDHLVKVERDTVAVGDGVGTDLAEIMTAAEAGDLELLARALAEWRGDFFEDLSSLDPSFDAWLQSERTRVQENIVDASIEAAKSAMAKGEIDAARKVVMLLQQHDGTNEVVLRLGLRLDHQAGDSAGLHRRYERFRYLLKSELDAAPSAETQKLFDELATKSSATEFVTPLDSDVAKEVGGHPQQNVADAPSIPAPLLAVRSRQWFKPVAFVVAIASICGLAWVGWTIWYKAAGDRAEPLLAVMPFQNLSTDSGSRDFSVGISKDITDALVQTTNIHVAPAPSSLSPLNAGTRAATHVLSGSVERVGNRVHIIAQLMDIADDRVVWGHAYDEAMSQTPAFRHDIAARIAGSLGKLLASSSFNAAPTNSAAFDHYLKGRSLFRQNDPGAAAAELEESIRLAPNSTNAWSTLAAVRLRLANDSHDSVMAGSARAAAQRAIVLDPNNGEALGALAMLIPSTHLVEIDQQFERALRAEPENTQLLVWYGEFLMFVGRNHEALDALKRAYILDRTTPGGAASLVLAALRSDRLDEAREMMDIVNPRPDNALRSTFFNFHIKYFLYKRNWFGLANYLNAMPGRVSPQMAAFLHLCRETATAFATHETERLGALHADWRSQAATDPEDAAQFLSALGDYDGALAAVEASVKSGRNDALLTDPQWEALFVPDLLALRRNPRFTALLAQWGLSDYWRTTNHLPDFMR